MKKILLFLLIHSGTLFAQDYLKPEIFRLDNGLTVYLMPDKNATTTGGMVVVKAGARQDPEDATGLAHYLEHLLFKGTSRMGTLDYPKERVHLDSIGRLYAKLSQTDDKAVRKTLQELINEQEVKASAYGLPTEFDKLLKEIGSTGINAFTGWEQTAYFNQFPAEQLEKWLDIYSERFQNPVFRSFQSELEVVYEEKNRNSDDFESYLEEKFNRWMFPNHPYGNRQILGRTEHLKNPRLDRIYEFYRNWYVAGNMALILVGNFDAETARNLVKQKFAGLRTGTCPKISASAADPIRENKTINIRATPFRLEVMGFRTTGETHPDEPVLNVIQNLLNNQSETGLLDVLMQDGKVMAAYLSHEPMGTDGSSMLLVIPKILGQSFAKAEKIALAELNRVISGDFPDELLDYVKEDLAKEHYKSFERPGGRVNALMTSFVNGTDWEDVRNYPEKIKKVSREDVMRIASKYFTAPRITLKSRMGFPGKDKLDKPGYKALKNDKKGSSAYAEYFRKLPDTQVKPAFPDFEKDAIQKDLPDGSRLFWVKNPYNDIASLKLKIPIAREEVSKMKLAEIAADYVSPKGIEIGRYKKMLAKLHCSVYYYTDRHFFNIDITASEAKIFEALRLVLSKFQQPEMASNAPEIIRSRYEITLNVEKKNPSEMGEALREYVLYGKESEFLNRIGLKEIKHYSPEDFTKLFGLFQSRAVSVHYCGNLPETQVADSLPAFGNKQPGPSFSVPDAPGIRQNRIYLVHDKKARQSQIYFTAEGEVLKTEDEGKFALLNEYLGGGFSGLIVQEIREYRSLAYSTGGGFRRPEKKGVAPVFSAYVGCQSDKTAEAVTTMMNILRKIPEYPDRIPAFQSYYAASVSAKYPEFRELSEYIENAKMRGHSESHLKYAYSQIKETSFADLLEFYRKNLQNKPVAITIYGNLSKLNRSELNSFGEIIELSPASIRTE